MFLRKERAKLQHRSQSLEKIYKTESIKGIVATDDLGILRKIYTFVHEWTKDRKDYAEPDYTAKMIDLILNLKNPKIIQSCYVFISDIAREDGDVNE